MVWYYRLLKNFPQFIVIHTVKVFDVVNKAKVGIFFWNSLAFSVIQQTLVILSLVPLHDGNLMSGSSAFSKPSLNIWKFTVHVLFKPGLENFEHHFASVG